MLKKKSVQKYFKGTNENPNCFKGTNANSQTVTIKGTEWTKKLKVN